MPRRVMPETITRTRNLSGAARTMFVSAGVQDAHDYSMGHGRHPGDGQVAVRRAVGCTAPNAPSGSARLTAGQAPRTSTPLHGFAAGGRF
jgi:hypothetical protein